MKKITMLLTCILMIGGFDSQAQGNTKSPPQTAEGMIGETNINIAYNAPSVRGRVVFGELEKFGKFYTPPLSADEVHWMLFSDEANVIENTNEYLKVLEEFYIKQGFVKIHKDNFFFNLKITIFASF